MGPPEGAGEDIAIRRRRLRYRAAHRGTRELDLLLGPYAATHVEAMSEAELAGLERLLDEAETAVQGWLLGQEPMPPAYEALIAHILEFKRTTP